MKSGGIGNGWGMLIGGLFCASVCIAREGNDGTLARVTGVLVCLVAAMSGLLSVRFFRKLTRREWARQFHFRESAEVVEELLCHMDPKPDCGKKKDSSSRVDSLE
jgi:hypothetical protein